MIILQNIFKSYSDRILFENLYIEINEGDFYLISGASGSGKSTLLNIISMLDSNYSGNLYINGIKNPKMGTKNASKILRKDIGYLFQNYGLLESESILENFKVVGIKDKDKILKCLKELGVSRKISDKIHTLSGGEQQRVAMAKIILKDPNIILCDEPTGSLDDKNRDFILQILKDMHLKGKTIVIVSHDSEVEKLASKILKI